MHDIDGAEIYSNYQRETLTREAEQDRKILQAERVMATRKTRPIQIQVQFGTPEMPQLRIEFY